MFDKLCKTLLFYFIFLSVFLFFFFNYLPGRAPGQGQSQIPAPLRDPEKQQETKSPGFSIALQPRADECRCPFPFAAHLHRRAGVFVYMPPRGRKGKRVFNVYMQRGSPVSSPHGALDLGRLPLRVPERSRVSVSLVSSPEPSGALNRCFPAFQAAQQTSPLLFRRHQTRFPAVPSCPAVAARPCPKLLALPKRSPPDPLQIRFSSGCHVCPRCTSPRFGSSQPPDRGARCGEGVRACFPYNPNQDCLFSAAEKG